MATSLTSTGVTFPDATTQTTAATSAGGTLEAVASGALSTGDMVVVNTDGTVSVVYQSITQVEPPTTAGETAINAVNSQYIASAYDASSGKVVVAYKNDTSANGVAVVGTISGSTISFGTPVNFLSGAGAVYNSVTYLTEGRVAIAYRNDGDASTGYVRIGTVSGTSISFGTAVQFSGSVVGFNAIVYHPPSGNVVVYYRDGGDNYGYVKVGVVSGTSVSFPGSAVAFNSADSRYMSATYESNNQVCVVTFADSTNQLGRAVCGTVSGSSISLGPVRSFSSSYAPYTAVTTVDDDTIVVAYRDDGNSYYGTAKVGSVSGSDVTFGSAQVYFTGESDPNTIVYDSIGQKIVVGYRAAATTGYGFVIAGTVSGTSISFGTAVGCTSSNGTEFMVFSYAQSSSKTVVVYSNSADGSKAYAKLITTSTLAENLTAENFIGVSDGNYSDTDTATVLIAGSVSDAQTGLTAGQTYYVQNDGTLSTTPDDPSVFAGTAISSTKLIVQG